MDRGTSNSQTSKFSLVFSHEVLSLCASQFPILLVPPGAGRRGRETGGGRRAWRRLCGFPG